jgi:membrane protease YdiL (CAAX protease family)
LKSAERETFLDAYFNEGRSVSLNLFFTVPLLILYEIGIQLTGSDLRNAAEIIMKDLRLFMGAVAARWFHWFLLVLLTVFFWRVLTRERPVFRYFLLMLLESLLLALVLGPVLSLIVGSLLLEYPLTGGRQTDLSVRMLLSVGAGVYEEFLFRFIILGGLFWIFTQVFKAPRGFGAGLAVALSAFFFAAYHHLGPFGQSLTAYLFLFRFGAGIILGLVFVARGFGVAVYLHIFYDIIRDIELTLDAGG